MGKKNVSAKIALYFITILVFNVIYFNIIENHTPARWVSYVGIHMAYLLLCVSSLSYNRFDAGGSVVHVYPKMMVAHGYFMASLICGAILILINNSTITFPAIVHALIIGFYLFHYLILMNAEAHTTANEQRNHQDALFIKDCVGRLELVMERTPSRDVRRTVERFRDVIAGASMRTSPHVADLESRIRMQISQVEDCLDGSETDVLDALVREGLGLVRERERQIQLYK